MNKYICTAVKITGVNHQGRSLQGQRRFGKCGLRTLLVIFACETQNMLTLDEGLNIGKILRTSFRDGSIHTAVKIIGLKIVHIIKFAYK